MPPLFFHLGAAPELAVAELSAVHGITSVDAYAQRWLIATLGAEPRIDRLGSIVRIADVLADDLKRRDVERYLVDHAEAVVTKRDFGFTLLAGELPIRSLGMRVKEALKEHGKNPRFDYGGGRELATVLVRKKNVEEILLLEADNRWIIARTRQVQDVDGFAFRDMHKPKRDLERGLLPPKLARTMINLARVPDGGTVYDPFVGDGVTLIEAADMGYAVLGSDNDPQAVEETRINLSWYGKILDRPLEEGTVRQADATTCAEGLAAPVDAIVSEGTLGPLRKTEASEDERDRLFAELTPLYTAFFAEAAKILRPGGSIVMTLPSLRAGSETARFTRSAMREVLPETLTVDPLLDALTSANLGIELTDLGGILVQRESQIVGREVVRFTRAG